MIATDIQKVIHEIARTPTATSKAMQARTPITPRIFLTIIFLLPKRLPTKRTESEANEAIFACHD